MATVLFVDFNHAARKVLSEVLRNSGLTVLESSDLADALLAAKDYSGSIDVLIAEAAGGTKIVERLTEKYPRMRTIFIGSPAERAAIERHAPSGDAVFLTRPLQAMDLLKAVTDSMPSGAAA